MMKLLLYSLLLGGLLVSTTTPVIAQHSVARQWNEVVLDAIRKDYARPTVHARNLFHISAAMYDAWAAYDLQASPYFLGRMHSGFHIPFSGVHIPENVTLAQEEAMSYAVYRLLEHRFVRSPGILLIKVEMDALMASLGYDPSDESTDYVNGSPAALGNYIASQMLAFGDQDGSFESAGYKNQFYAPVNEPMVPELAGVRKMSDPNRWQPLAFGAFVDQSGHVSYNIVPEFLSAEWGYVTPFALNKSYLSVKSRDQQVYWVYHDPGAPPRLDIKSKEKSADYVWSHEMVALWSAHLDPTDGVLWDISPGAIGNLDIRDFPATVDEMKTFYDAREGGDHSAGHPVNPFTQQPYAPQVVPRGDYTRVLAEFWADGPDSETPPGHWFTILNYVNDHPRFEKRYQGEGPVMDDLEWDVKAYFTLGGAMHDAAIASWGIKGYYDYIRPISAIRYMASLGQSSDQTLRNYHPAGIKLAPGRVEVVKGNNDPLSGQQGQHIGKIKLYAWRGPTFIQNPETDDAGVGWILAENWWPYQRPTFVTPPFAGYVSGHSTYSRAGAEVLTSLTGSAFFPGGMGEFVAKKNEFLVFEEGPSVDVVLQWATYRDASDQCSLSRIWGGIHPPVDDIPGRLIGEKVGKRAFEVAKSYFQGVTLGVKPTESVRLPNPVSPMSILAMPAGCQEVIIYDLNGRLVRIFSEGEPLLMPAREGIYLIRLQYSQHMQTMKMVVR